MSLGILGTTAGSLEEEKNIIQRAAQGETPGISFGLIDNDDISKAKEAGKQADSKYQSRQHAALISGCVYGHSLERDINYAIAGRKYMRCTSFNNRMACAYARAQLLAWLDAISNS